jgi:hypothetical protein
LDPGALRQPEWLDVNLLHHPLNIAEAIPNADHATVIHGLGDGIRHQRSFASLPDGTEHLLDDHYPAPGRITRRNARCCNRRLGSGSLWRAERLGLRGVRHCLLITDQPQADPNADDSARIRDGRLWHGLWDRRWRAQLPYGTRLRLGHHDPS